MKQDYLNHLRKCLGASIINVGKEERAAGPKDPRTLFYDRSRTSADPQDTAILGYDEGCCTRNSR